MGFCSTFGSILWKFLCYVAVLQFYKTKRFVVFKNLGVISMWLRFSYVILCGVYTYFCAVFIHTSVQFCSICSSLMSPSCMFSMFVSLLRWLNTVLAVCEYTSFAKSWQENGCR